MLMFFAVAPARATTTEQIFDRASQSIAQVQVIDRVTNNKGAIGSGFWVSERRLVTNYHVVSELLLHPEKYRAEYVHDKSSTGAVQILAVDVVHDLALLGTTAPPDVPQLALATAAPSQGQRVWSLGNPYDLGLTIVEGNYNGFLERSRHRKIHFTGSINPGMSGGPAVNDAGEVIGVNVATAGNQVSFLVPAAYVNALIARAPGLSDTPPDKAALLASVRDALLDQQSQLVHELLEAPMTLETLGQYRVPGRISEFMNCWGGTTDDDTLLFQTSNSQCRSEDDIFLSASHRTGTLSYQYALYSTRKLGTLRFYRMLEGQQGGTGRFAFPFVSDDDVTEFECDDGFTRNSELSFKLRVCLRGYQRLAGLYDINVVGTSLNEPQRALVTTFQATGVSFERAIQLVTRFFESIRWQS